MEPTTCIGRSLLSPAPTARASGVAIGDDGCQLDREESARNRAPLPTDFYLNRYVIRPRVRS